MRHEIEAYENPHRHTPDHILREAAVGQLRTAAHFTEIGRTDIAIHNADTAAELVVEAERRASLVRI